MTGTILQFHDGIETPTSEVRLANGDTVRLVLDGGGLVLSGGPPPRADILFRAKPATVAAICAGLVGPKRDSQASPLRLLTAIVQAIGSAREVRAAFEDAAASLG